MKIIITSKTEAAVKYIWGLGWGGEETEGVAAGGWRGDAWRKGSGRDEDCQGQAPVAGGWALRIKEEPVEVARGWRPTMGSRVAARGRGQGWSRVTGRVRRARGGGR